MTTKTDPNLNATDAHSTAHVAAQDLVRKIQELLHDEPEYRSDAHWGHVGDLCEINNRLSSVVDMLTGNVK